MSQQNRVDELREQLHSLDDVTPAIIAFTTLTLGLSLLQSWLAVILIAISIGPAAFAIHRNRLRRPVEDELHHITGESRGARVAWYVHRPLSFLSILLALLMIVVPLYQRSIGSVYLEPLNYVDGTTIVMVGVLILRGVLSRRSGTDLQAVAIALTGALSFVFAYEAMYKLSFYTFPWRMPPPELREFVIQVGIALTALNGFAFGKFVVSRPSLILLAVFVIAYVFWLLVGFPQLNTGQNFYPAIINIPFTWDMIYVLGRVTKIALFLVYFFFYSEGKPPTVKRRVN